MRKTLLATAMAAVAVASPAAARDGSPYLGIEGGVLFPKDQDANVDADFTSVVTQTPATPVTPFPTAGASDTTFDNAFGIDYKRGLDLDVIVGYDFGAFRLEGELGWKRAKLDEVEVDDAFISSLNTALNLPAGTGDTGTLPALVATDFDLDGRVKVLSGMVNGLLDFEVGGFGVYAGAGIGRARVKFAGERDSSWAGQLIAGVRTALSDNVELGLKYRYFRTRNLDFTGDSVAVAGNGDVVVVETGTVDAPAPVTVTQTTSALLTSDFEQKFRSHSLLASLIFNFGAPEAAPPPPPPPVETPPPPPPPQTQTCPDGSVILATDQCPAPPPPPPPPAPAPERG